MNYLLVALGGALGSACRYGLGSWLARASYAFPWATLLVNFLASLILGFLIGYSLKEGLSASLRVLFMAGFCGGFSTFSTFSAETMYLIQDGKPGLALLNVGLSVLACLGAVYLGTIAGELKF
jgi:fluoride exporter